MFIFVVCLHVKRDDAGYSQHTSVFEVAELIPTPVIASKLVILPKIIKKD